MPIKWQCRTRALGWTEGRNSRRGVWQPRLYRGVQSRRIERGAEYLTLVNCRTAVDDPAANHPRSVGGVLNWRLPDFFSGQGVDCHRLVLTGDVHHAIVDERLRLFADVIVHAVGPHRYKSSYGVTIDLAERTQSDVAANIFRSAQFSRRCRLDQCRFSRPNYHRRRGFVGGTLQARLPRGGQPPFHTTSHSLYGTMSAIGFSCPSTVPCWNAISA